MPGASSPRRHTHSPDRERVARSRAKWSLSHFGKPEHVAPPAVSLSETIWSHRGGRGSSAQYVAASSLHNAVASDSGPYCHAMSSSPSRRRRLVSGPLPKLGG